MTKETRSAKPKFDAEKFRDIGSPTLQESTNDSDITTIPISELRLKLARLKRQVQLGNKRLAATVHGEVVGYLVPVSDVSSENSTIPIENSKTMPLTEFRDNLTESWEAINSGLDCIYLTFHGRSVIVFLGKHLFPYLTIPVSRYIDSPIINISVGDNEETNSNVWN